MMYTDLRLEVEAYLRKIRILEDWFTFVVTREYLRDPLEWRPLLNAKRPANIPTITDLRKVSKTELVGLAESLSLYAQRLDDLRHDAFRIGKVPGMFRAGICSALLRLESGDIERFNWTSPFTIGIYPLAHVFGPIAGKEAAVKFSEET